MEYLRLEINLTHKYKMEGMAKNLLNILFLKL